MANKDLGFGKTKLDLSGFEPRPTAVEDEPPISADSIAEKAGFVSREPVERLSRVRKLAEPTDTAYIRAPISVINRLKIYCNENGLSYGQALEEMMRKAGI
ncbi:hypothetical protein [Rhizobium mongolense]|uniref:BrnA antitoxin of type II toxin-antitoxin system n=2 Tax=Rhizobium mongolense TaxID=57676 RepID=A0ABR6ISZ4_9HYPH|nr:hypothetical protein [Rhizobium mongolense]MBB4231009.1 hypothetical protein [Rhizobium mongolense]TVZ66163.1 hypothetical protein BCL32_6516 [Rhizobium mongolense USDA 1844]